MEKIIKLKRNFSQFLNKIGKKKSRKKKEKNNSQGKYKKELCNLNIMLLIEFGKFYLFKIYFSNI